MDALTLRSSRGSQEHVGAVSELHVSTSCPVRYEDVAKGPTPAGPPRARRTPGCLEFDVRGYF